eukprot:CAMPEP_0201967790 /NCGR_PEP_ID=MMETSP0904-20121228/12372_1 /ASSEMBLY_ACC=CAM_ASM_000553 /TAXON_ID=420261 /ORGANISM="Thalassiosira antarctica, Strain CCMP982" /LENGTH=164 /DNA_ID=CAMNT_0048515323 /DNA_START=369 /DNA_END=863 /DNA_ORIENTATION=-
MIPLEANVGKVNPFKGSRIHGRLFCTLVKWYILAEAAAEADGSIVASKATSTSCIVRHFVILSGFSHDTPASVDEKSFPNITTDDIVNSIDVLVVVFAIEDKWLIDFFCDYRILLLHCPGDIDRIETTRRSSGHCTLICSFPHAVSASFMTFAWFLDRTRLDGV